MSEAPAGDQHESLGALGELVEELHRHAASEGVPDDARALDADHGEQVPDAGRMGAERVVAARGGGVAVADEVGRDHRVAFGEASATLRQWREELTIPWMSTTGGPLPAVW